MEKQTRQKNVINNAFYDELGEDWFHRNDHPIALLRAENVVRAPWVCHEIQKRIGATAKVLDIGCGAGLLSIPLSRAGHQVTGIDLSKESLAVAEKYEPRVRYLQASAYALPFESSTFDVVCAMDLLEHIERPSQAIAEASRVLRENGLFFFHTFNRNPLSYWVIIKGVEWFVRNTPKHMHIHSLFITPNEISHYCSLHNLVITDLLGLQPNLFSYPTLRMLLTRRVPSTFSFRFTRSLATGYCGIATKQTKN